MAAIAPTPTIVFLGPSLPREEARELLPSATFLPPAARGDVYRVLPWARTIVLVDGVFHGTPSVWHRELLAALEEGIVVIGASSMGALRAAELDVYGMRGVGTIYDWYRDGVIDDDDEVALLHADEEYGFRALSEPLVNVRHGLERAVRAGLLADDERATMLDAMRSRYYAERSWDAALDALEPPLERRTKLRAFFGEADLKREDARRALSAAGAPAPPQGPGPRVTSYPDSPFLFDRLLCTGFRTPHGVVTGADVLRAALDDEPRREAHRQALTKRAFATRELVARELAARKVGGPDARSPAPPASDDWLVANGITRRSYEELHEECAALDDDASFASRVRAWADEYGITPPEGITLEDYALTEGPGRFGFGWHFETALLLELQRTGEAAAYALRAALR